MLKIIWFVLLFLLGSISYLWMSNNLVIPDNRPNFRIYANGFLYDEYQVVEENGCVKFDQTKVCGSYTIIKLK